MNRQVRKLLKNKAKEEFEKFIDDENNDALSDSNNNLKSNVYSILDTDENGISEETDTSEDDLNLNCASVNIKNKDKKPCLNSLEEDEAILSMIQKLPSSEKSETSSEVDIVDEKYYEYLLVLLNVKKNEFDKLKNKSAKRNSNIIKYNTLLEKNLWILPDSNYVKFLINTKKGIKYANFIPQNEVYLQLNLDNNKIYCKQTDRAIELIKKCYLGFYLEDPGILVSFMRSYPLSPILNIAMAEYALFNNDIAIAHERIENAIAGIQGGISFKFPCKITKEHIRNNNVHIFRNNPDQEIYSATQGRLKIASFNLNEYAVKIFLQSEEYGNLVLLKLLWFYGWSCTNRGYFTVGSSIYSLMLMLNPLHDLGHSLLHLPNLISLDNNLNKLIAYDYCYVLYIKNFCGYNIAVDYDALFNYISNYSHYATELNLIDYKLLSSNDLNNILNVLLSNPSCTSKFISRNKNIRMGKVITNTMKKYEIDFDDFNKASKVIRWNNNWFDRLFLYVPQFMFAYATVFIRSCLSEVKLSMASDEFGTASISDFWSFVSNFINNPKKIESGLLTAVYMTVLGLILYPSFTILLAEQTENLSKINESTKIDLNIQIKDLGELNKINELINLLVNCYLMQNKYFWLPLWKFLMMCTIFAKTCLDNMHLSSAPLYNTYIALAVIPKLLHYRLIGYYNKISIAHFNQSNPICPINLNVTSKY